MKYYKGKYKIRNVEKYKGDPTNVIYRSSWELKFMRWCDVNPSIISWSSEETIIPYVCPTDGRPHRYFVDFRIQLRDKNGVLKTYLVEIKPEAQTMPPKVPERKTKRFIIEAATYIRNEAKWKAATQYAKDRGWEFIKLTEKHLGIK